MRVPRVERRRFRVRGWMIALVVVALVLLFSLRGLAGFYTEFLWFDSVGQSSTWWRLLGAKVVPAAVFTVVFFLIMWGNLLIADRLAPRFRPVGPSTPEDEMVSRYQQATARYHGRIRVLVSAFFALVAGIGVSGQWKEWILFTHRVSFGRTDPQFHRDIGFYVFQLPFLRFIVDWLFAGLVIVLLVTAVAHYLNGGIRFQSPFQRVTPQVKAHLSVVLAVMALVKTAEYYLARFELDFSSRGVVDGAGYTDVKAQLPALNLLIFISIVAAGLFIWNIWRRGWVLPIIAVGLWGFVSVVVGTIYPTLVQNLRVNPNEFAKERPYIARNIRATREAWRLDDVQVDQFPYDENLLPAVVEANRPTIDNARLWDPDVIRATYATLQEFQTYYRVNDVDVDRYVVDGETIQTVIAARELNGSSLPSQSWVNEHLVYTHGYGAIASPTNQAVDDGTPIFFVGDIPPKDQGIKVGPIGAQVYFSEQQGGYVIVDAKQPEFNYPRQGLRDSLTRYRGRDGVRLSSVIRRAAFALSLGDANPLISGQVTSRSRILLHRSVRDRVEKLAPFLDYDLDPYPVVIGGRMKWVLDAFTTSSHYPYSQTMSGSGGLSKTMNYVRNSVKATVDAYDGTVRFYVVDPKDPVIRSYRQAFPDLFSDFSEMPAALKDHLRYPEDLFKAQSDVFSKYHVVEPRRFYQGNERWLLSPDPNEAVSGATVISEPSGTRSNTGRAPEITAETKRQDPYYLYIRLPGDDRESFLMMQPFVPVSKGNQQTRLVSFMTAKSDPGSYGRLQAFVMPQGQTVLGPVQAALKINQQPTISRQFSLLDQRGSRLIKGSVQLIAVGNSIIYVQPIYIEGQGTSRFPQYQYVAMFAQGRDAVLATDVNQGLTLLFGPTGAPTTPTTPTAPTTPTTPGTGTVEDLLGQAADRFNRAEAALRAGDLGQYQDLVGEAQDLVKQAQELLTGTGATTPPPTTTTAPTAAQAAAAR